ncbi:DNA methyltransferase 1-associated protein 1 [Fistulifera solaris]|uniref:DNA methyltransferase 1-associated protein 1 n=1 Tax=Fistulifera solaris TaxID=1519565 RepID=A0A1Z5JPA3_FISSO|nr:DNA methyltransferase 1-associated protein 1 [Fistulifera solaris]|eukprot:GAX15873.1 DNA methyltransferase 1-associated protein 1 [Fistulifera solaris]
MTDVAEILGVKSAPKPVGSNKSLLPKPYSELTGSATELPTTVPTFIKIGNKQINSHKPARKWTWAPFSSSSRPDGLLLNHWVRANVEYPDYPYARFDIHLDPVQYTIEEYKAWLTSENWSQSETDTLMDYARIFELRWPVIHDRWCAACPPRPVEDLKHRFYTVAAKLLQRRVSHEAAVETKALEAAATNNAEDPKLLLETAAARSLASSDPQHQPLMQHLGTGTSNKVFDLAYEKERRAHWEALWNRTKEEEAEELALRNELKQVETQLRKLKKRGAHVVAASGTTASRAATPIPAPEVAMQQVDQAMTTTAPTPVPGVPYLQSARLVLPATGGETGISKALVARMEALLAGMNVPSTVIATKRACDLMDTVRRDALTWLLLQKQVIQKEGVLRARRLKLAKMGGNIRVVDEETLLGIAPPPAPRPKPVTKGPAATAAAAAPGKAKASASKTATGSKLAGKKPAATASSSSTTAASAGAPTATTTSSADTKTKKPAVKRKRKSEDAPPAFPNTAPSSDEAAFSISTKPKKKAKPSTTKETSSVSKSAAPKAPLAAAPAPATMTQKETSPKKD